MTASFETRPSGTTIAKKAWHSSAEAFGKMKPLFLSAIAISLVLGFATFYLPYAQIYVFQSQAMTTPETFTAYLAAEIVSIIIWMLVSAPVAVAVHRFILMGRITPGIFSFGPRYTRSFFFWAMGLQTIVALLNALPSFLILGGSPFIGGLTLFALAILGLIALVHLAMIFPAVATEVPSAHWQARMTKSWRQMSGHSWLLVRAAIIAFLPWVLVYFFCWILFGGLRASQHHGDLQQSSRLGLALLLGGARIPFVMLGAAVVSWLYAWVRQQADPASDPA